MICSDLQTLYMINISLNTANNLPNNVAIFLFSLYIKFYKINQDKVSKRLDLIIKKNTNVYHISIVTIYEQ